MFIKFEEIKKVRNVFCAIQSLCKRKNLVLLKVANINNLNISMFNVLLNMNFCI